MNDDEIDAIVAQVPDPAREGQCMDDGVLQQYRLGELDEKNTLEVEHHLARCADCSALVAALGEPLPEGLERWGVSTFKKRRFSLAWLPAAAVLLFALGATFVLFNRTVVPQYEIPELSGGVQPLRAADKSGGNVFSR